ncbi:MAG: NUDIX hydrolase [Pseudomonadota bacterium]
MPPLPQFLKKTAAGQGDGSIFGKMKDTEFNGAKVALFVGGRLLVILRDDLPSIPWPNWWDFPGGGREDGESAAETVIREIWEEVRVALRPSDLVWERAYATPEGGHVRFFVAHLPATVEREIVLGDEGQRWALWAVEDVLAHPRVIPYFKPRLMDYLSARKHHLL